MEKRIIIGVFCYNRAAKLKKCIEALLKNPECASMDIVFFSDGYKKESDKQAILEVRAYIDSITGFKSVIKHYRDRNFSTGPNFRTGLTFLSENYDEFIVVEDDLIVSPNYIKYLLDGLDFYRSDKSVFCITAYVFPIHAENYKYDTIVYKRFCSYGWAGWGNRFPNLIWDEDELENLMNTSPGFKKRLNAEGQDLYRMLKKQISGVISTWDIQMQTHVAENRLKVIYPTLSKVSNIGFDDESTNTSGLNYLISPVDDGTKRIFNFCDANNIVPALQAQIKKPYGFKSLVIRKLINEFLKFTNRIKKAG
ncbi:glycosyltransferase [Pedobacter mucosus]|uniref:glycosyltransferase n=1 Tax=Pedobacter mucosus TaxID=2895286 RepID=UPI001EE4C337|nr:glycosyltransferase [Pedobacter mucosus]UKT62403.1 glycosyltransferase [Pedobacter mucosus]